MPEVRGVGKPRPPKLQAPKCKDLLKFMKILIIVVAITAIICNIVVKAVTNHEKAHHPPE
jgi:hypothetical protein